jgi:hypothetical protein
MSTVLACESTVDVAAPALYFPQEGFGAIYRRRVLNEFLADLVAELNVRTVAEMPLDEYGVPGAGSLVLGLLGCETTLVSSSEDLLAGATRTWRERIGREPRLICSEPWDTTAGDGAFDLSWSFDRLQAQAEKTELLAEQARVSEHVLIIVPNAWNYGQPWHWLYHAVFGRACDFVGPRRWLSVAPVIRALEANGMEIVRQGLIDVPWWPGFPELPALARRLLKPAAPDPTDLALDEPRITALMRKAERATFIERSRAPMALRRPFAHNLYVLARHP